MSKKKITSIPDDTATPSEKKETKQHLAIEIFGKEKPTSRNAAKNIENVYKDLLAEQVKVLNDSKTKIISDDTVKNIYEENAKILADKVSKDYNKTVWSQVDKIIKEMQIWLKEFNLRKEIFEKQLYINNAFAIQQAGLDVTRYGVKTIFNNKKRGRAINYAKDFKKYSDALFKSYLQGYKLWFVLRELITQQEIFYSVLYSDKSGAYSDNKKGTLYEAQISLTELLERGNFSLSYNISEKTGGISYDIKFDSMISKMEKEISAIKNQQEKLEKQAKLQNLIASERFESKFYLSLQDHFRTLAKEDDETIFNRGALYETYVQYREMEGFKLGLNNYDKYWDNVKKNLYNRKTNRSKKPGHLEKITVTDNMRNKYNNLHPYTREGWAKEQIKQNLADKSSGRKVGDQGLFQAKNISYSGAQLSAVQTLYDDIANVVLKYNKNSKRNTTDMFLKYFTYEEGEFDSNGNLSVSQLTRAANKSARAAIESLVGNRGRKKK